MGWKPTLLSATARLLHPLLQVVETQKTKEIREVPRHLEPLFIVGAPRSGSTILYQTLTNQLDVVYPNNLCNHFYRDFLVASLASQWIYGDRPHGCFKSVHGRTYACGMNAPSEFSGFWYQFFPADQDFVEGHEVGEAAMSAMRNKVYSISTTFHKPLIFKNLHLGQKLRPLHLAFPSAKIIFIKRSPADTALSVLAARKLDKVPDEQMWSAKPKNHASLLHLQLLERVVAQQYYLEKEIFEATKAHPSFQLMVLRYEDFCHSPMAVVDEVSRQLYDGQINQRNGASPPIVQQKTANSDLRNTLEGFAANYDWVNYSTP